jgi:hypothetical protein
MFIDSRHTAKRKESKQHSLFKAFLQSYFLMFFAPTLKGEHQKIRLPSGLRGNANFHLFNLLLSYYPIYAYLPMTTDIPCGIPANALPGQQVENQQALKYFYKTHTKTKKILK